MIYLLIKCFQYHWWSVYNCVRVDSEWTLLGNYKFPMYSSDLVWYTMAKYSCLSVFAILSELLSDTHIYTQTHTKTHKNIQTQIPIYIYIYIIVIMTHHQHSYLRLFLATLLYRQLLPACLQEYIPCWHRDAVCRF